jgi:hypothetical protein
VFFQGHVPILEFMRRAEKADQHPKTAEGLLALKELRLSDSRLQGGEFIFY